MSKLKLFRVTWIEQGGGLKVESYVLAENITKVDDTYSDIVSIEPLDVEEL